MKLHFTIILITMALTGDVVAGESPIPSSIASPAEIDTGKTSFDALFKTVLSDSDFFVCESNITVSTEKKSGTTVLKEDVFYSKASKRNKNGEMALMELSMQLEPLKQKALQQCREENSERDCLTKGLINNESRYTGFDYASKKIFLESLVKSCAESKATCLSATASKSDCFVVKLGESSNTPKVEASPAEAKAPTKK